MRQQLFNRLSAHAGFKGVAVFLAVLAVLLISQQHLFLQGRIAFIDDDPLLIIEDFFQGAGSHVKDHADTAGQTFVEPDVGDRHGQLQVTHALTANASIGDFNAATVADDALVLLALVFAAVALPVLHRTENPFAEQTAFFRLERAVVNRLRVLDFAVAPGAYPLRRSDADADAAGMIHRGDATDAFHCTIQGSDPPFVCVPPACPIVDPRLGRAGGGGELRQARMLRA